MLPRDVLNVACKEGIIPSWEPTPLTEPPDEIVRVLADWLVSPQAERTPAARRYLFYLKWMYETFHAIAECFPKHNVGREGHKDYHLVPLSRPREMLYLANHLYVLDSYGVAGAVLECGCFQGYTSCCLSHACTFLSRDLIVADSFEGLPAPAGGEAEYYSAGDYAATLAQVRNNVQTFGRPECVRYLEGWFRDSLQGWDRPLVLLWTDVDLYRSTLDVLENVFTALDPRAVAFSHEFSAERILAGQITYPHESPGAYRDFMDRHGIEYWARYLYGWTAAVAFPTSEAYGSFKFMAAMMDYLRESDHRVRVAQSLTGLWRDAGGLARRVLSGRRGPYQ